MKSNIASTRQETKPKSQQQKKMSKRPENKDNLDSREGEEQDTKGDDTTHNKKEKHIQPKKKG